MGCSCHGQFTLPLSTTVKAADLSPCTNRGVRRARPHYGEGPSPAPMKRHTRNPALFWHPAGRASTSQPRTVRNDRPAGETPGNGQVDPEDAQVPAVPVTAGDTQSRGIDVGPGDVRDSLFGIGHHLGQPARRSP